MSRRIINGQLPVRSEENGGRPCLLELNPLLIDAIIDHINIGAPFSTAAYACGIDRNTLTRWLKIGKANPESWHGVLCRRISEAKASALIRDLKLIDEMAHGKPAEFEMEPMRDNDGGILIGPNGEPRMQPMRDANGNPVLKSSEVKPNWRPGAWKLEQKTYDRLNQCSDDEAILEEVEKSTFTSQNTPYAKHSQTIDITPKTTTKTIAELKKLIATFEELGQFDLGPDISSTNV